MLLLRRRLDAEPKPFGSTCFHDRPARSADDAGDGSATPCLLVRSGGRRILLEASSERRRRRGADGVATHGTRSLGSRVVLLLAAIPELPDFRGGRAADVVARGVAAAVLTLALGAAASWMAGTPGADRWRLVSPDVYASAGAGDLLRSPADLFLLALLSTLASAAAVRFVGVARVVWRRRWAAAPMALLARIGGGTVAVGLITAYQLLLEDTVRGTVVDVLRPSLQPLDSGRFGLLLGLVLAAVATVDGAASCPAEGAGAPLASRRGVCWVGRFRLSWWSPPRTCRAARSRRSWPAAPGPLCWPLRYGRRSGARRRPDGCCCCWSRFSGPHCFPTLPCCTTAPPPNAS